MRQNVMHPFSLLVYVVFLIVLFEGCLRLFGRREAMLIILLVSTRVIFFVQSTFIYPEVMVAMFAFLSLYFYSRDHLLLASLMLFMLFFTKEGGLVFGGVIAADAFISLFRRSESLALRIQRLVAVLLPFALIGIFFRLQKDRLGWYVLPEHTGMIKTDWESYYIMFKSVMYWAYRGDRAMYVLVFFILLLSAIPAMKSKNIRYLFLIPPMIVVYAQAEMLPEKATGGVIWAALYLLFITIPVYYLLQLNKTLSASSRRFIILMAVGVVGFLFYSSLTQVAYRYLIVAITFILIFLALCITTFSAAGGKQLFYFALCAILPIGAYGFYTNKRTEDTELGAFRVMNVQLREIAFLEKEKAYDKEIAYGCAWEMLRFTDTLEGFLSSGRSLTHMVFFPVGPHADYALFGNSCGVKDDYRLMVKNPDYHLVFKTSDGDMWAEIYKRN